ncbi:hypothetical protein D3C78_1147600 [compost metagenome]
MTTDTDLVRHRLDGIGHGQQDIFEVRLETGAAQVKHWPVLSIHDLDTQAILGDFEEDLVLEFLQLRVFFDLVLQFLQQQLQTLALNLLGHALNLVLVQLNTGIRSWLGLLFRVDGLFRSEFR